jgi:glycopeptide antibiotics resistance protein
MRRRLWKYLFVAYLAALVLGTFSPFTFVSTSEALAAKVQGIKWIPFRDPRTGGLHSPLDTAGNIAMFMPFGALGVLALRGSRDRHNALLPVVISGFSISLLIEALQLFTRTRVTNVTDVIANTIGCSLAALAVTWWQQRKSGPGRRRRESIPRPDPGSRVRSRPL